MPSSITDERAWERAKAIVIPRWHEYVEPYAVVMHVYKNIMREKGKPPFKRKKRI